jgi:hypothetical protein
LALINDRSIVSVPAVLPTPPPEQAKPLVTQSSLRVRTPLLTMSPPKYPLVAFASPPAISIASSATVGAAPPFGASTLNTRSPDVERSVGGVSSTVVTFAPEPAIVTLAVTGSSPKDGFRT